MDSFVDVVPDRLVYQIYTKSIFGNSQIHKLESTVKIAVTEVSIVIVKTTIIEEIIKKIEVPR